MHDLGLVEWDEPYVKRMNRGIILGPDSRKMSKRWGNVVEPDNYVKELGADTVRMYLAFIGPYNEVGAYPWDPKGIMGVKRFLDKVWRFFVPVIARSGATKQSHGTREIAARPAGARNDKNLDQLLHRTIKKVTGDIENFKFNTAVSALMILVNELSAQPSTFNIQHSEIFPKLLAPFAPYLAEELWQKTRTYYRTSTMIHREFRSIHQEPWPEYDEKLVEADITNIPVQINGKHRATIKISKVAPQGEVEKIARESAALKTLLAGKKVKKVIYVKGKIINFVV